EIVREIEAEMLILTVADHHRPRKLRSPSTEFCLELRRGGYVPAGLVPCLKSSLHNYATMIHP
ncbi:MAG: hypothetical protein AAFZ18_11525, partial [Myxococcota bacterium]